MLASPVIRRSSVLTDKLLRLLSLISVGQPDVQKNSKGESSNQENSVIRADHLKLAVEVLTSKACSEEGLEDVNALLLNLSYGPEPTRDTILKLLLQGAQELGSVVRQNVLDLQLELRKLKQENTSSAEGDIVQMLTEEKELWKSGLLQFLMRIENESHQRHSGSRLDCQELLFDVAR